MTKRPSGQAPIRRVLILLSAPLVVLFSSLGPGLLASPVAGAASPPVVTGVSPPAGPLQGTIQVSVQGSGFFCGGSQPDPTTKILFGATQVAYGATLPTAKPLVQLVTDTRILVDLPSSTAAGPVDVTI